VSAKERPILFSAPMVRAILGGAKTQTRRVVKDRRRQWERHSEVDEDDNWPVCEDEYGDWYRMRCPYGVPGDRLWVKETWYCDHCFVGDLNLTMNCGRIGPDVEPDRAKCEAEWRGDGDTGSMMYYRADGEIWQQMEQSGTGFNWRSPRFMPRWASRILLEITDVSVQRVQDISDDDAIAEGLDAEHADGHGYVVASPNGYVLVRDAFRELWGSINAKRGFGWAENPWVWALTFRRVQP